MFQNQDQNSNLIPFYFTLDLLKISLVINLADGVRSLNGWVNYETEFFGNYRKERILQNLEHLFSITVVK